MLDLKNTRRQPAPVGEEVVVSDTPSREISPTAVPGEAFPVETPPAKRSLWQMFCSLFRREKDTPSISELNYDIVCLPFTPFVVENSAARWGGLPKLKEQLRHYRKLKTQRGEIVVLERAIAALGDRGGYNSIKSALNMMKSETIALTAEETKVSALKALPSRSQTGFMEAGRNYEAALSYHEGAVTQCKNSIESAKTNFFKHFNRKNKGEIPQEVIDLELFYSGNSSEEGRANIVRGAIEELNGRIEEISREISGIELEQKNLQGRAGLAPNEQTYEHYVSSVEAAKNGLFRKIDETIDLTKGDMRTVNELTLLKNNLNGALSQRLPNGSFDSEKIRNAFIELHEYTATGPNAASDCVVGLRKFIEENMHKWSGLALI